MQRAFSFWQFAALLFVVQLIPGLLGLLVPALSFLNEAPTYPLLFLLAFWVALSASTEWRPVQGGDLARLVPYSDEARDGKQESATGEESAPSSRPVRTTGDGLQNFGRGPRLLLGLIVVGLAMYLFNLAVGAFGTEGAVEYHCRNSRRLGSWLCESFGWLIAHLPTGAQGPVLGVLGLIAAAGATWAAWAIVKPAASIGVVGAEGEHQQSAERAAVPQPMDRKMASFVVDALASHTGRNPTYRLPSNGEIRDAAVFLLGGVPDGQDRFPLVAAAAYGDRLEIGPALCNQLQVLRTEFNKVSAEH